MVKGFGLSATLNCHCHPSLPLAQGSIPCDLFVAHCLLPSPGSDILIQIYEQKVKWWESYAH